MTKNIHKTKLFKDLGQSRRAIASSQEGIHVVITSDDNHIKTNVNRYRHFIFPAPNPDLEFFKHQERYYRLLDSILSFSNASETSKVIGPITPLEI